MRRLFAVLLSLALMIPVLPAARAENHAPTRTINLVYDDSGSMIRTGSTYVDTWCQAKYAMEVFAGMLSERETLNIYYMSDYVFSNSNPPKLSLTGSKDASITEANVKQIHDLVTDASDTPFEAVKKAYADIRNAASDERWLVVLTDGEFNSTSNERVERYFQDCAADGKTNVMMLSMGPNAASITPHPEQNIYFEKAESTTDILSKLTKICNRIFQSNALPINPQTGDISFNVPMGQLVVFAQGKEVSINGITNAAGQQIQASSNVRVQYSSSATTDSNYSPENIIVADDLMGYVATYNTDFEPGTYHVDVTGAEDIQVYYKPNVSIAAYLYNGDREEVTASDNLIAGTYQLEFGFVNGTNGERVTDTSLLGNIEYQAMIATTNAAGERVETPVQSGDTVEIGEGGLDIDVTARFLEYNTVNTQLSYEIYSKNDLIFTVESKPDYHLDLDGFQNAEEPIVVSVQIDSPDGIVDLTEEELALFGAPVVTTDADLGAFRVEEGPDAGTYLIYPEMKDGDPLQTADGTVSIKVSGGFTRGLSSAAGELTDTFEIASEITALDRAKEWLKENWIRLTISLAILLLILGYVPPFKRRFPRNLKKRPYIECRAEKIGIKDTSAHGKFKKDFLPIILPYWAETGKLTFSPAPHKKTAQLRAAGGHQFYVTNTKSFAGKSEISFNGMSIEKDRTKPYLMGSGSPITLRTTEYTYTCYLNKD